MRTKGGLFVEFCLGLGVFLLIAASVLHFAAAPGQSSATALFSQGDEAARRHEALLRERDELEEGMETYEESGRAWLTPKGSPEGDECRFDASVSAAPGGARARVLVGFARSEDEYVGWMVVAADGEEQELALQDLRAEPSPADEEGRVSEVLTLPAEAHLPLLERVAESGRAELRFLGDGEARVAVLSGRQIRGLRDVLRLRKIYEEIWALEELRRIN